MARRPNLENECACIPKFRLIASKYNNILGRNWAACPYRLTGFYLFGNTAPRRGRENAHRPVINIWMLEQMGQLMRVVV